MLLSYWRKIDYYHYQIYKLQKGRGIQGYLSLSGFLLPYFKPFILSQKYELNSTQTKEELNQFQSQVE